MLLCNCPVLDWEHGPSCVEINVHLVTPTQLAIVLPKWRTRTSDHQVQPTELKLKLISVAQMPNNHDQVHA